MDRYYFDHNATTPVAPEVAEAMLPILTEVFGNASSIHYYGQMAKQHLEKARQQAAALLHCKPREVVFTSGGTEADNLAILGSVRQNPRIRKHVITTAIEHPAVLASCAQLEREGVEMTYLPVGSDGLVDPRDVQRSLRLDTVLISIMHANNEVGVLQPIEEIGRIAREAEVLLHSDGVQAAGKVALDMDSLGVDLYSVSGHKIYAPKGIGVLYVRNGVRLAAIFHGGHHERDRRPGTENVAGAFAFGSAAEAAARTRETEAFRLGGLRDRLETGILDRITHAHINGAAAPRMPNTSSIRFDGVDGEAMVIALDLQGFAVSTGAACSSGAVEPSHVLKAMGLADEQARSSLRFSLGRSNTAEQVDALVDAVASAADHLRKLSPTYSSHA